MPRDSDDDNLRIVSVCHYILAGLVALASCIPGIYVLILALAIAEAGQQSTTNSGDETVLYVFVAIALFGMLAMLLAAAAIAWAGRLIGERRGHGFCMFLAALQCLAAPLGTILGVFTILILIKPRVKERFGIRAPPWTAEELAATQPRP